MKSLLLALLSSGCLGAFHGATVGSAGGRTPTADPAWQYVGQTSAAIVPASEVRCLARRDDPDERRCWRVNDRGLYVESVTKRVAH